MTTAPDTDRVSEKLSSDTTRHRKGPKMVFINFRNQVPNGTMRMCLCIPSNRCKQNKVPSFTIFSFKIIFKNPQKFRVLVPSWALDHLYQLLMIQAHGT